jgi:hypothetical protein
VLLLTPHPPDAAQHTGSFVEPNILLGAASACQTLYDRSWRIVLKNSMLKPTVIADSFNPVGAGDRIDDGSAAG